MLLTSYPFSVFQFLFCLLGRWGNQLETNLRKPTWNQGEDLLRINSRILLPCHSVQIMSIPYEWKSSKLLFVRYINVHFKDRFFNKIIFKHSSLGMLLVFQRTNQAVHSLSGLEWDKLFNFIIQCNKKFQNEKLKLEEQQHKALSYPEVQLQWW